MENYVSTCQTCKRETDQHYKWIRHNLDPKEPVVIEIGLECEKCGQENVLKLERRKIE